MYHYAGNNPVKYVDPDGRCSKPTKSTGGIYILILFVNSEVRYTSSNPINQEFFDSRYGFTSTEGTVSCKTNSLINIYATKHGVTQTQLDNAVKSWKSNGYIDDDGSPLELNGMSKVLAKELGLSEYYSLIYPKENNYNQLEYASQADFEKSKYEVGIQTRTKPGHTHYTATIKNLFGKLSAVLDSLKPDRPGAEDYSVIKVEPMTLYKLPEEDTK